MRSLRTILNEANPNKLPSGAQELPLGNAVGLLPSFARGAVAADTLLLPERRKAVAIIAAYAVAGGATGALEPVSGAPAAGEVGVGPTGDVVFAGADAVTQAEVVYATAEGEVIEETGVVTADVFTFSRSRRALLVLEAEALTGGATGVEAVVARGTAAPAAGQAALQDDSTLVNFAAADAVTSARVKYVAQPGVGDQADAVNVSLDAEDKGY